MELGCRLKERDVEADFKDVRAGVYFGLVAAVAVLMHPGDTGDLPFFVHTSEKLLSADWANVFADPNVQVGPLQLLLFRLGDLAGVLALLVQMGTAGLLWIAAGRLLTDPWARFAVSVAAVALGLTNGAYQDGHPAQVVVPLLWVLAACDAREGRMVRAGALVGLSAGFELWGMLGAAVFVLAPRLRAAFTGVATQVGVAVGVFLPFLVLGEFRMFDYRWRVNGDTLLSLFVEPGSDFTWSMRLLQGIAALAAGVGTGWVFRRSAHAVWLAPLMVVTVRLALDPVRYPWYWLAAQTLILLGAAALLTSTGFARMRHERRVAAVR